MTSKRPSVSYSQLGLEGCPSPAASGQNADERCPDRLVIGTEVRLVIGTLSRVQTRLQTVEAL